MPRPLPHEIHEPVFAGEHPRPPREHRHPKEEEPTHAEIFDALMDVRERLERIEHRMDEKRRVE